jgi:hypothetical protein
MRLVMRQVTLPSNGWGSLDLELSALLSISEPGKGRFAATIDAADFTTGSDPVRIWSG